VREIPAECRPKRKDGEWGEIEKKVEEEGKKKVGKVSEVVLQGSRGSLWSSVDSSASEGLLYISPSGKWW
jgi:hypothetical protein